MENEWVDFDKALQQKRYLKARKILQANQSLVPQAMEGFYNADVRRSQAYAHMFDRCKTQYKSLLEPHFAEWVERMKTSNYDSFLRNSFRYFQSVDVHESLQGELYDLAFEKFMSPNSAIAIRVFAMTTCFNIGKFYPELLVELRSAIERAHEEDLSAGMISRSKKVLSAIDKIIKP